MHDEGKGVHMISRGIGMIRGKAQARGQCEGQVVEGLWGHRWGRWGEQGGGGMKAVRITTNKCGCQAITAVRPA